MNQSILIAGGYGVVGKRIAWALAADFPNRVIVAGRNAQRAHEAAERIGYGVRGLALDITDSASISRALKDVSTVVSCIDQPERKLLWAALRRGLRYTDIAPHLSALGRGQAYEQIVSAARASGARIVLGTGIVPGISNVMVRVLSDRLGGADEIETCLLLNANDITGAASFDYLLQQLSTQFSTWIDGADRSACAFSQPRVIQFPEPFGKKAAYLFPFSDQVLYPRTMGVRTALTRLAIEPAWVARLLHLLTRTGASRLLATEWLRRMIARTRRDRPPGQGAEFVLRVEVRCGSRVGLATLLGRTQADAAAAGAAGVVQALLLEGNALPPGAWMPEEVIEPDPFLKQLERRQFNVRFAS